MAFQSSDGPVQVAADGLVNIFLVGRFDDEGDRRPRYGGLHRGRRLSRRPTDNQAQEPEEKRLPETGVAARLPAPISVHWELLFPPQLSTTQASGGRRVASYSGHAQQGPSPGPALT